LPLGDGDVLIPLTGDPIGEVAASLKTTEIKKKKCHIYTIKSNLGIRILTTNMVIELIQLNHGTRFYW
jgi:hypothetical protein